MTETGNTGGVVRRFAARGGAALPCLGLGTWRMGEQDANRHREVAALRLGRSIGYGSEDGPWLPIGVGVHTGVAYVGTVSGSEGTITDFTALGDDVNIAARLVEQARAGQVCVSDAAYQRAGLGFPDATAATITVKGKSEPIHVHILQFAKGA